MSRLTIAGSVAQRPGRGGHAWVFLQYLLGLRRLGHEVLFLDRLDPAMCAGPDGRPVDPARSPQLRELRDLMESFGLGDRWSVICAGTAGAREFAGLNRASVLEFVRTSDWFLNFMGFVDDGDVLEAARRRVFVDIDPGFGQMWHELGLADLPAGYDAYVTVGRNVGRPGCSIPTCGVSWIGTFQPVVLGEWPAAAAAGRPIRFTSVATWRGDLGPVPYRGRDHGLRVHEFRRFLPLPSVTGLPFEVALDIHPSETGDLALLRAHGWRLRDPLEVAGDPRSYRDYIRRSGAEFMVAKNMYVETRSGWFSDRSICYLASGKPVLAQDTGLEGHLPVGEGLLAFSDLEEAATGAERIASRPERHAAAARALAEAYFDSDRVLDRLLDRLGARNGVSVGLGARNGDPARHGAEPATEPGGPGPRGLPASSPEALQ